MFSKSTFTCVVFVWSFLYVGGSDAHPSYSNGQAAPGQFPFIAAVQRVDGGFRCTGFIFNDHWVVSGIFCVPDHNIESVNVIVGFHQGDKSGTSMSIERIEREHHIDLIRTKDRLIFNSVVQPIDISDQSLPLGTTGHLVAIDPLGDVHWSYSQMVFHMECVRIIPTILPSTSAFATIVCGERTRSQGIFLLHGGPFIIGNKVTGLHMGQENQSRFDLIRPLGPFKQWIIDSTEI